MKFTDKYILNLKPQGKIVDIREGDGFGVRILPSGTKTFFFTYRVDGKRRFLNLGPYQPGTTQGEKGTLAYARKLFNEAKKEVNNGKDPLYQQEQVERERVLAPTMAELGVEYMEKWAKPRKRSWKGDQWILDKKVIPKWGKRKANEIRRRDVVLFLEEIAETAPVMANGVRSLLHKMFNFALEREVVEFNPCFGVKKAAVSPPRERCLSDGEIKTVWTALDTPGGFSVAQEIPRALKLVLLTGQRPGEVIGMHSSEISGDWWTIPAERSKNKREHRVFLTGTAKRIIGEKVGYIFESPRGGKAIEVNALAHAVRRTIEGTNPRQVAKEEGSAVGSMIQMVKWTPHDLRRTVATKLSELGFMDEVIDSVLNHKKRGIVATYNRNRYDREKQMALEAWERKLLAITSGKGVGRILSLVSAKR